MPRRRYRLFTVCALVIVFMLYRVAQNSWDEAPGYGNLRTPPPPQNEAQNTRPNGVDVAPKVDLESSVGKEQQLPADDDIPPVAVEEDDLAYGPDPDEDEEDDVATLPAKYKDAGKQEFTAEDDDTAAGAADAKIEDADTKVGGEKTTLGDGETKAANAAQNVVQNSAVEDEDVLDAVDLGSLSSTNPPKGGSDQTSAADRANPATKTHWHRVPENFPVDRLIRLPSGTPKKIPKIQYDFGVELGAAKTTRVSRQNRVKIELERAWAGYKKYAWMHDELSPVSAKYRDPFCGWAATLVDSLDTLWIAGMKKEFHEAAKAVGDIDFTWTPRRDIPVFETTIRYLGGLVGAYDVSGGPDGEYKILLDKAIELAEILLGIFDTPNRLPLLYYQWKPDYAAQPHRAGRVGIAELATLSMEFTRLAQITGEDKYYDGVARITDALVEMQDAGTAIPGLFPENVDASGCNRTATTLRDALSKQAKQQLDSEDLVEEPLGFVPGSAGDVTSPSKTSINGARGSPGVADDGLARRGVAAELDPGATTEDVTETTPQEPVPTPLAPPFTANGRTSQWDCVPQGLVPSGTAYQNFHMGGAQDSAYEYFPKEYLLLGGLEPKYQKLHEDTIDAVNEWLLYRPMAADKNWDVLFPAKVTTSGSPETDIIPVFEITHLTCFIGGMYGLGGKIFGRDEDIEIAKKLTDGCVWAYQLTPSGLMPESSHVIPCPTLDRCEFNETLWWEWLDPSKDWREQERIRWEKQEEQKALLQAEQPSTEPDVLPDDGNSPEDESSELNAAGDEASQKVHVDDATEGAQIPRSLGKLNATSRADGSDVSNIGRRYPPSRLTAPKNQKPLTHEEFVTKKIQEDKIPPGFIELSSKAYILRPEAIESVWYMYRITGDPTWMDKGWAMFQATVRATRTEFANSAISDVMFEVPELRDEMESFWLAETLKYYYLLFSEPDVISLDEWVLNTEAHPFRRPTRKSGG